MLARITIRLREIIHSFCMIMKSKFFKLICLDERQKGNLILSELISLISCLEPSLHYFYMFVNTQKGVKSRQTITLSVDFVFR